MSAEKFIADRIARPEQNKGNISRPIVKIGMAGISIGVAVMILTVSIVLGFKREIINKITGLTTHIVISNVNLNASNEPEPIAIAADSLNQLRQMAGIVHLQGTAFKNGLLKTEQENEGVLLKGVGRDYDFSFIKSHLKEGSFPKFSDTAASKELLVSELLADRLHIKMGDRLTVYFIVQYPVFDSIEGEPMMKSETVSRRLTVCGIFNTGFSDFDKQLGFVDLRLLQVLNHWQTNMVGSYEIHVENPEHMDQSLEQVQDYLGYNYNSRTVREIYSNMFVWLDKLDINGIVVVVLMILVATINMITALLILILERANMVGLVKVFGMTNVSVRGIFLRIAARLVLRGMVWGNVFGIGLCLLQYYFHLAKLDASTYYVEYVAIYFNWPYILILDVCTLVVCALMLILPTLILTKMTPIKTLKLD